MRGGPGGGIQLSGHPKMGQRAALPWFVAIGAGLVPHVLGLHEQAFAVRLQAFGQSVTSDTLPQACTSS